MKMMFLFHFFNSANVIKIMMTKLKYFVLKSKITYSSEFSSLGSMHSEYETKM